MHGLLEDLLAFELPFGLAEDAVLVRVSGAHAMHAQDFARLAVTAEPLGQQAFLWSVACSTTAAAPSPNNTAMLRSLQSMNGEMTSAPITSALFTTPVGSSRWR